MNNPRPRHPLVRRLLLGTMVLVIAGGDLLIKSTVVQGLGEGKILDYGVINIRLTYNPGVAFSLGASLPPGVVATVTAAIVAVLAVILFRAAPGLSRTSCAGAALLLGGALGNLVDRMDGAGVVDYLHTGWFPTFNLADIFVVSGATLLALSSLRKTGPTGEEDSLEVPR